MITHSRETGVLVITVHPDSDTADEAGLFTRMSSLVRVYDPDPVVVVLTDAADAAVEAVLRVHCLCTRLGLVLSVASHSAPVRRLLEANADTSGARLIIHARADTAITTAGALTSAVVVAA
jgi:hypothetical protein